MLRRRFVGSGLMLSGALAAGSLAGGTEFTRSVAKAAEFTGISAWLNTPESLSIAQCRGSVVLVNFWTYSCINSRRPMVYLKRWHAQYSPAGLRVIGIHTPEFQFEHNRSNVETYVKEAGIQFPVALDNSHGTWDSWDNQAWPGFHLVDRHGRIVLRRYGEGYAYEMEMAIRDALGLPHSGLEAHPDDDPDFSGIQSPEMYFGAIHPTTQAAVQSPRLGTAHYTFAGSTAPNLNRYLLDGTWTREDERLVQVSPRGGLRVLFWAAKLYMVAYAPRPGFVRLRLNGGSESTSEISWPTLYTLVDGSSSGRNLLEIDSATPGLTLYSTTFG